LNQTVAFQALGGLPITFSTYPDGDTSGTEYNVIMVLEQLE
jgi:hypothetical protein